MDPAEPATPALLRPITPALALGLVASLGGLAYWLAGSILTAAAPARVGAPPPGLPAETVRFPSRSGTRLTAWVAEGDAARGTVVLLHGIGSNRMMLADRAVMLHRAGYGVVAVDLQAHGESEGERITFGHRERQDAVAAVAYARARFPGRPVGVVGVSLGGAASLLAGAALGADAVVAEAVFADIRSATANRLRLRLGRLGAALAPVLLVQLPWRTGAGMKEISPADAVAELQAPLLVIAGTEDLRTTVEDTRRLFAAATEPKALWWVEGAAHEDFLAFAPAAYRARVLAFFEAHLGG